MHDWQSLSHVRWECKYHVVFIPKYRRKVIYGKLRQRLGPILRELCRQKGVDLLSAHRMSGLSFWATGYSVSTVGLDEHRVRQYIREQEKLESNQGELDLK